MTVFVALLRAVNVGGTGKLAMSDLKQIAAAAGFTDARTYIASGNLVFSSGGGESSVKAALEAALRAHAGMPIAVMVRSAADMAAVLAANPFADKPANRVAAIFLDAAPAPDALSHAVGQQDELLWLGRREIYVFYPSGQGQSKLRIPAGAMGTARNINTVTRLAAMAAA